MEWMVMMVMIILIVFLVWILTSEAITKKPQTILIKFPSRGRPDKLISTYQKYREMSNRPTHLYFLFSLDEDDHTVSQALIQSLTLHPNTKVVVGKKCGKIGAVNRDMEHAPDFDILLLASDDMIPIVRGYDDVIRDKMSRHYPDTDGVLFFNDGHQQNRLNTICILGRRYYQRFGYIYHPAYKSLWCDNEFTEVANLLKKQTYFPQVIIRHFHPSWSNETFDPTYEENQKFESADRATYLQRRDCQFTR